MSEDGKFVSCY